MTEHHVLETTIATSRQWLHELMVKLQLAPDEGGRALHALRAGLHAIRDRLPAADAVHLGAQLPVLVRGLYYEGWRLTNDPTQIRTRAEMLDRVQREIDPDRQLSAMEVLSSVIALLNEHVSAGEISNVVSTLPRPIAELWRASEG
jgi:uncharacterized protein (DUF2267 family)